MHQEYDFHFCPVCGGRLESVKLKPQDPLRLVCSDCAFVFYLDPKLSACAIVEKDGKILLTKRDLNPRKGKWALPGGHVDRGEIVEDAACREILEECGIMAKITGLLGVYSNTGQTVVLVVYLARYLSGELVAGEEISEIGFFDPEKIPWEDLAFQDTVFALKDYCNRMKS
ncbi:MAG: NUDIX domain-containing protein [Desulfatiglandales bacterium]